MILVVDSGSTQTVWCFISNRSKTKIITTGGINPYFCTSEDILKKLNVELKPEIPGKVERIFFYGAGIINDNVGRNIKNVLAVLFPESNIETYSDLQGAARATLHNKRGIACILGTGSNSCLYDGDKILEHVRPLGFVLGDEGSGAVLGKKLLADYLKAIMPQNIADRFKSEFPFQYADYLQKVYRQEQPNRFLATLVPFIHKNLDDEYCRKLCEDSFSEFIERNILQYTNCFNEQICFVGSVAFYFSEVLYKIFEKKGLNIGIILKEPMEGLIKYHLKK
ncbi:MAG: ATPase [Bacteroidales bacterium]|jgi:N-acetylglucosamine kinase-like BadF-type ATPase|nr:ATPase [Bacteroidales bacterium]